MELDRPNPRSMPDFLESSKTPLKRWSTKRAVPAFLSAVENVQRRIRDVPVYEEEVALDVCLYATDVKH